MTQANRYPAGHGRSNPAARLGRRQDAHAEAGKDLAALVHCRGIVGRG